LNEVVVGTSDKAISRRISQDVKKGTLRKLAPRLYSYNLIDTPEKIILRNWYQILSLLFPGGILSYRSAVEGRPANGHIFITYSYTRNVKLPGLTIHLLDGSDNPAGIIPFFQNLQRSGEARAFLENMQSSRSNKAHSKTLNRTDLEKKLDDIVRARGEDALNNLRDEAKKIARQLGLDNEYDQLNKLVSALLSTGTSKTLSSAVAQARAAGEPFDPARIDLFHILYHTWPIRCLKTLQIKILVTRRITILLFLKAIFQTL
jgi:hypothetical protein